MKETMILKSAFEGRILLRFALLAVLFLVLIMAGRPERAFAEWKVYYTGKAAKMFGSYGRGNFATKARCEAYRSSSAGFERSNSYCSGFDAASAKPPIQKAQAGAGNGSQAQQAQALQLEREQKEKEAELARQQKFEEEKVNLLGALKGTETGNGALGLKLPPADPPSAPADPQIAREQNDFVSMNMAWQENQKKLIRERIDQPNRWSDAIYRSLKTKAPPQPYKSFGQLQPGDVLLIAPDGLTNSALNKTDRALSGNSSGASHTVLYLKEINGKKLFLENIPGEGPRIILEEEFLRRYGHRDAEVASLGRYGVAQPLKDKEGDRLYAAAKEMAAKNREKEKKGDWFDSTGYGVWDKDNVVCSEADWALLKAAGRNIPKSEDRLKGMLGVDFSPADFYGNGQYFLVTPLSMPR